MNMIGNSIHMLPGNIDCSNSKVTYMARFRKYLVVMDLD